MFFIHTSLEDGNKDFLARKDFFFLLSEFQRGTLFLLISQEKAQIKLNTGNLLVRDGYFMFDIH
jgi:hypothetical protein